MEASCMMMGVYNREASYDEDEKMMTMNMNDACISESSNVSKESSSSDLLDDDASSSASSSSSSSSPSNGPLYELSELMDELPIKRGLSKFYKGKSQSFTSLGRAKSLEDLAKKETAYERRLKASKSYGVGLNNFRSYTQPKPTISKKPSNKPSLSHLSCLSRKPSFTRPPLSPVKTN